jgi:hypothetical protein
MAISAETRPMVRIETPADSTRVSVLHRRTTPYQEQRRISL